MTSDPDLEAKTRLSPRPILDDSLLGKGVSLWRGVVGSCPDCPKVGGGGGAGGTSICHLPGGGQVIRYSHDLTS